MKKTKLFGFAVIALLLASMIMFNACPPEPTTTVPEYTIKIDPTENGTIKGPAKAKEGATVNLTVTPIDGYRVYGSVKVTPASGTAFDAVHGTGDTYTFKMPKSNVTVSGSFVDTTGDLKITVNQPIDGGGTVTSNHDAARPNETITLTATPENGFKLDMFTVTSADGVVPTTPVEGQVNSVTFTMPSKPVTVTATFIDENIVTYHITLTQAKGGEISVSKTSAKEGDGIVLTATSKLDGYSIEAFIVKQGGNDVALTGSGNSRTFVMPAGAVTVTATWVRGTPPDLYTLGAYNLIAPTLGWGFDGNGGYSNWVAFQAAKYLVIATKSASNATVNFPAMTVALVADGIAGTAVALNDTGTTFERNADNVYLVIELSTLANHAAVKAKEDGRIVLTGVPDYANAYLYKNDITEKPGDAVDLKTFGYVTKDLIIKDNEIEVVLPLFVRFNTAGGTPAGIDPITVLPGEAIGFSKMPADPVNGNQYFTGWYLDDVLYDETTIINNPVTLVAKYQASGWTPTASELKLDLLGQQAHFQYMASGNSSNYTLPLATSTVVAKNYGNIRIRFPGGFDVKNYENVTIKYRFATTTTTTSANIPHDPVTNTQGVYGSTSYLADAYFYSTWNGYGNWMTTDEIPTGANGTNGTGLSADVQTSKGVLLRMGGRSTGAYDGGPNSSFNTQSAYLASGNPGATTIDDANKGFTTANTMTVNPQGFVVNKQGGGANAHIRIIEIRFWNETALDRATIAVNALTTASAWTAYSAANDLIKAAQTSGANAASVIATFKTKIEAKITPSTFAEFLTWVETAALPTVDRHSVSGSEITLNYLKSGITGNDIVITQPAGWAVGSKTANGTAVNTTTLTYGIGNTPAADKVEYTLKLTPVVQYNVTFAANAAGTISIGGVNITDNSSTVFNRTITGPIGTTVISVVSGSLEIAVTPTVTIAGFTAASQIYAVNVTWLEPVADSGELRVIFKKDQDWAGIPAAAFELSQQSLDFRTVTLTGLGTLGVGDTVKWYMDGQEKVGTNSSFLIKADDLARGPHSLTVVVKIGGVEYSSPEIKFTVVR